MASAGFPATNGDTSPPTYGDIIGPLSLIGDQAGQSEPPIYSQSNQPVAPPRPLPRHEFNYTMKKGGNNFFVMTLISKWSQAKPIFLGGYPIEGKISVNVNQSDSIKSVVLTVKGVLTTGEAEVDGFTTVFLEKIHKIWSQEERNEVLRGEHTWSFSLALPDEVPMAYGVDRRTANFRLPQTFGERHVHSNIMCEISVKVARKSFFRSDNKLVVPIWYIPIIRPPALSVLRRLAYENNRPIPGPEVDPDRWFLPRSVELEGKAFNDHNAHVKCKLFLAKPLTYTRGSAIPLFMTLESDDKQVLDLLSASTISVRVRRRAKWTTDTYKPLQSQFWRDEVDHSQRAVWWPATEYSEENATKRVRRLCGELHLKPDMAPTSAMSIFTISYSVVLLRFNTPAFQIAEGPSILEQSITVVTAFAAGPRPKLSTAADYTPDISSKADESPSEEIEYFMRFY